MAQPSLSVVDQLLATQLDLIRLEASARNDAFRVLSQMERELIRRLNDADLTSASRARINSFLKQTTSVIEDYYARIEESMSGTMTGAVKAQARSATDVLNTYFVGVVGAQVPPTNVIKATALETLIMGAPSSEWWDKQAGDLSFKFANVVRQGVAEGETISNLAARVSGTRGYPGIMDTARSNARSLVHTSIMEVASEARRETYRQNDDVVEGVQQVSTLDSSTTEICIAYDGAQYTLDGEPMGDTELPYNGGVPRHWGCRSVEVPVTKSFKEMGIDVPEPKGGERASADGPVKASTTFDQFLDRMGKEFQDETLGEGRADLWRDGKITLQQLLDLRGNPMSLDQLERKYG